MASRLRHFRLILGPSQLRFPLARIGVISRKPLMAVGSLADNSSTIFRHHPTIGVAFSALPAPRILDLPSGRDGMSPLIADVSGVVMAIPLYI